MRHIGFSTGAVACSDFQRAIHLLAPLPDDVIELSALRWNEVKPLLEAIPSLQLEKYNYIAVHAPSKFDRNQESLLVEQLERCVPNTWTIILHPDSTSEWKLWRRFGSQLAVENMDRRKPGGRTVEELEWVFEQVPDASFCFDIGHARQCDSSMTEAYRMLCHFGERLKQIHISEVNSMSLHDPISFTAMIAFQQVASLIPNSIPVIIESRVTGAALKNEMEKVEDALTSRSLMPAAAS